MRMLGVGRVVSAVESAAVVADGVAVVAGAGHAVGQVPADGAEPVRLPRHPPPLRQPSLPAADLQSGGAVQLSRQLCRQVGVMCHHDTRNRF